MKTAGDLNINGLTVVNGLTGAQSPENENTTDQVDPSEDHYSNIVSSAQPGFQALRTKSRHKRLSYVFADLVFLASDMLVKRTFEETPTTSSRRGTLVDRLLDIRLSGGFPLSGNSNCSNSDSLVQFTGMVTTDRNHCRAGRVLETGNFPVEFGFRCGLSGAQQPVGWILDLNDGVRLGIRPFLQADVLRKRPDIKRGVHRGKKSPCSPWVEIHDNDRHLSLVEKQQAGQSAM